MKSIVTVLINLPCFAFLSMRNIFISDSWSWIYALAGFVCLLILLFVTKFYKYKQVEDSEEKKKGAYYILFGIMTLICGIFPYEVIRGRELGTDGIAGRDSLLMPLGFAIVIYYILDTLRMQKRFKSVGNDFTKPVWHF